jgi:hypothetical protein
VRRNSDDYVPGAGISEAAVPAAGGHPAGMGNYLHGRRKKAAKPEVQETKEAKLAEESEKPKTS